MVNKKTKRCSSSLLMIEMQIKASLKLQTIYYRLANHKATENQVLMECGNVRRNGEALLGGSCQPLWKRVHQKYPTEFIIFWVPISLKFQQIYERESMKMFTTVLLVVIRSKGNLNILSWLNGQIQYCEYYKVLCSSEKEHARQSAEEKMCKE